MRHALAYPAALGLALAATPSLADWGGVAVNADGIGWGYSAGWNSRADARDRAMHYCREYSENDAGCSVAVTTRNCAAIVRGRVNSAPTFFVVEARNRDAAETGALTDCREVAGASCELRRKFCADDL